jgi:hypothetical protein
MRLAFGAVVKWARTQTNPPAKKFAHFSATIEPVTADFPTVAGYALLATCTRHDKLLPNKSLKYFKILLAFF